MIHHWGAVPISKKMQDAAQTIKHLSYKTTTPARFQVKTLTEDLARDTMDALATLVEQDRSTLDYVYFSVANGAEPHTDLLDPEVFADRTFVIPVILPMGETRIIAEGAIMRAELGQVYEFNHERTHAMTVEDNESGCVVIMVAIRKKAYPS